MLKIPRLGVNKGMSREEWLGLCCLYSSPAFIVCCVHEIVCGVFDPTCKGRQNREAEQGWLRASQQVLTGC
jgi:hypothetical protein